MANNSQTSRTRKTLSKSTNDLQLVHLKEHIHYSYDLEGAILGACMLETDAFPRIRGLLTPECFFKNANMMIFNVISDMWARGLGLDLISVCIEIHRKSIEIQGVDNIPYYLTCLTRDVVGTGHLEQHCIYLREYYAKRELLIIQMGAGSQDGEMDTVARALDVQRRIQDVLSLKTTDDWMDISTVMHRLAMHMDRVSGKDMMGIPTGFHTLDRATGGWQPGQVIIVGARPSVGKTALAVEIAIAAARAGHDTGIIELEMPVEQIGGRMLSSFAQIEFWRIWRSKFNDQDQVSTLYHLMGDMSNLPIQISDKTNVSISDIRAKAIKLKKRGKLKLLMIDYLQLMEDDEKSFSREQAVSKMSRGFKLLAMELGIPIIVLIQMNRESEKAADKRPRMSNARESGAIEQDADLFIILHRDWKSGILTDQFGNSTERQAQLILEKHRNGEPITLDLNFDPETMYFYE